MKFPVEPEEVGIAVEPGFSGGAWGGRNLRRSLGRYRVAKECKSVLTLWKSENTIFGQKSTTNLKKVGAGEL